MQRVSVFFAGSTKPGRLDDERNQLKVLADDLSAEKNIQVVVYTFEHLGQTQSDYDRLIKSKADLVICVLTRDSYQKDDEGKHGMFTLRELSAAIKSYDTHKAPEVFVFYPKGEGDPRHTLPSEIVVKKNGKDEDVAPFIRSYFDDHHPKEYNGYQDLMKECRKIFEKAIEQRRVKTLWKRVIMGLATVCVMSGLFFCFSGPKLLMVGGGSVANHIINAKQVKIDNRPNTTCIRMPSGASIVILAEEVNRMAVPDGSHKSKFVPVCMSARKAEISEFTKVCTEAQLLEKLKIIEYEIGTDPLAIFMDKSWYAEVSGEFETVGHDVCITNEKLLALLRRILTSEELLADVFATSPGSGTREMYRQILDRRTDSSVKSIVDSSAIRKFHENYTIESNEFPSKRLLALGSVFYPPRNYNEDPEKSELVRIIVTDISNVPISKKLYIYFAAKKKNSAYYVPQPVVRLLHDMGFNGWDKVNRHNGRIDITTSTDIFEL